MNKDNIEEILKNIGAEEIPAEVHKNAQETSNNFSSSLTQTRQPKRLILLEQIMKSRITKLAAAAVIFIAVLAGLPLLDTEQGVVLADVLAKIEQVRAYRCQMNATFKSPDMDDKSISQATILTSDVFGTKTTIDLNHPFTGQSMVQEIYVLPPQKTITTLMPNEKKYSELEFDGASFDGWQEQNDPRTMIKRILECEYTSLGRSTIDGIEVEGFSTSDLDGPMGQAEVMIWVDVETKLPVRIEIDKNEENKGHIHFVICDFQWNVLVDAAEFEPVIPDDYTPGQPMLQMLPKKPIVNEETTMDQEAEKKKRATQAEMGMKMLAMSQKAVIDEQAATKGLKLFAELGSCYPEALDMPVLLNELAKIVKGNSPSATAFREKMQEMSDEGAMDYKLETMLSVQGLGRFYQSLVQDKKEPAYYGKSVTPVDVDQVLMRWKVSDDEYRIVFGDLSVGNATAEELANLEQP